MSLLFLIIKTLIIVVFLVMFLRTNKPAWGIGLLTVTSAILLDTFLSTLGRDQMMEDLGFFLYIIAGALLAGATIWLWAILKEFAFHQEKKQDGDGTVAISETINNDIEESQQGEPIDQQPEVGQMWFESSDINLLDLMFDLGWNDEDVAKLYVANDQFFASVFDLARERGQTEELKLAVERIKQPIPRENLPRLEKLKKESPPTILRQYLICHYTNSELDQMIEELDLAESSSEQKIKNEKVRYLLTDLYQANRIDELIEMMQTEPNGEREKHQ